MSKKKDPIEEQETQNEDVESGEHTNNADQDQEETTEEEGASQTDENESSEEETTTKTPGEEEDEEEGWRTGLLERLLAVDKMIMEAEDKKKAAAKRWGDKVKGHEQARDDIIQELEAGAVDQVLPFKTDGVDDEPPKDFEDGDTDPEIELPDLTDHISTNKEEDDGHGDLEAPEPGSYIEPDDIDTEPEPPAPPAEPIFGE